MIRVTLLINFNIGMTTKVVDKKMFLVFLPLSPPLLLLFALTSIIFLTSRHHPRI